MTLEDLANDARDASEFMESILEKNPKNQKNEALRFKHGLLFIFACGASRAQRVQFYDQKRDQRSPARLVYGDLPR